MSAGPMRRDERSVRPAYQQRPLHATGSKNGIDVAKPRGEGIVGRSLRFAASPLVVGNVPPSSAEFSDDPPPVRLSGELAVGVNDGDTGTAGVGDGQFSVFAPPHAGPRLGQRLVVHDASVNVDLRSRSSP